MPSRARTIPGQTESPVGPEIAGIGARWGLAALLLLAGCAGGVRRPAAVSDAHPRIGAPYTVKGVTYVPADDLDYDEVGLASWYGGEHKGDPTANGERFDPDGISAAHRTLPLPSYVEVTSLETGRVIVVRVNDRGPFYSGRIIDLSRGAARLLGIERRGTARARVRRVEPSEADKAALRAGRPASARPDAPPRLLAALSARFGQAAPVVSRAAPPPVETPAALNGDHVQVAALSDRGRAERLLASLADIAPGDVSSAGGLFRVRLGPFADGGDAASALARARARGYQDARIVR